MKKIFLTIQFAALMAGLPAFALVGGPFDNGEYSILNERNGFYESAFSFSNGSGYAIWTADNRQGDVAAGGAVTQNLGAGSLINTANSANNGNRTVLYYKGVTYFGSAFGEVDATARTIMGFCNASSDYSTQATTTTNQQGIFTATSSSAFSTSTVVSSGRNYTANVNWTGKITATSPQLRFSGSGELSIIAPNGAEAIASLAYTAYSQLVDAIAQSVSDSGLLLGLSSAPGTVYTGAASSIAQILNGTPGTAASQTVTPVYGQALNGLVPVDVNGNGITNDDLVVTGQTVTNIAAVAGTPSLASYLAGTGPDNSYNEAVKEKIKVTGYRRFF
jgi:hypothetical protein